MVLVEDNPDLRDDLHFQLSTNKIDITSVIQVVILLFSILAYLVKTDYILQDVPKLGIIMLTARDALETRHIVDKWLVGERAI